jgi:uncharacterized membrane protein
MLLHLSLLMEFRSNPFNDVEIVLSVVYDNLSIVKIFIFFFTVLQVFIGRHYAEKCPVNRNIPHYLVVAGSIGLASIILAIIQGLIAAAFVRSALKAAGALTAADALFAAGHAYTFCSISLVIFALSIFLVGWSIAGCVWVFGAWNKVQYSDPSLSSFCHPTLYRFTYWLLLISLLLILALCCCPICWLCITASKMKKNRAQRVPTSEP